MMTSKPMVNVGTIGHVYHGKKALAASLEVEYVRIFNGYVK